MHFIVIFTPTKIDNSVINRSVLSSLTKGREARFFYSLTMHAILNQRNRKLSGEDLCFTCNSREIEDGQNTEMAYKKDAPYEQAMGWGKNKLMMVQQI
jgi:hypothetical protein